MRQDDTWSAMLTRKQNNLEKLQSELGIFIIGEGRTVTAAVVTMVGGVLNCTLDYYFMGHLRLGIRGAAAATVIGYCSTIAYAFWFYIN